MKKLIIGAMLIGCVGLAQAQHYNTVEGQSAFSSDTSGSYNSAFGAWALFNNTTGQNNSAFGFEAMLNNITGNHNTGIGMYSLFYSTDGIENVAVGYESLFSNQNGNNNIAIGYQAGFVPTNGNNNIEIGHIGLANDTNVIRIGTQGIQRFTQIAGIYDAKVVGGRAVVVNSKGQLGYASIKVVPNTLSTAAASLSDPASVEDVVSLRREIAGLRNELNALKAKVH
jgi:hypothetical protein